MNKEYKIAVPRNEGRVNKLIEEVCDLDLLEQETEKDLNTEIANLKKEAREKIKDLRMKRLRAIAAICAFYLKNRNELTRDGKRKIVKFVSGEFGCFFPSKKNRDII